MSLSDLREWATDKSRFTTIQEFIEFSERYLDFIATGLQATIISKNESNYQFFQYRDDGHYNITRPINSDLIYDRTSAHDKHRDFIESLKSIQDLGADGDERRHNLNRVIYTAQQSIGASLDALPAGESNKARKINGDLFERFIQLILCSLDLDCESGVIKVPVIVDGEATFNMKYQHDLLISKEDELKIIGSVKTSSKDRIDKIFMDKFLYSKLTDTALPHIAVFLNDVQRKKTRKENVYGINGTFLTGHFKGFTVKLNPLDGVYYCDIRPNMRTEPILRDHIKTLDHLLCEDIWTLLDQAE